MKKKAIFAVILAAVIIGAGLFAINIINSATEDNITENNNGEDKIIASLYDENVDRIPEELKLNDYSEINNQNAQIVENPATEGETIPNNTTVEIVDDEVAAGTNEHPRDAYDRLQAQKNDEAIATGNIDAVDTRTREEVLVDTSREVGLSDDQIKALWFYEGNNLGYVWPESREYDVNADTVDNTNSEITVAPSENDDQNNNDSNTETNNNNPEKTPTIDNNTTNPVSNDESNTTSTDRYNSYDNVWTPPADFVAPGTTDGGKTITETGEVVEFEDDDDIRWE